MGGKFPVNIDQFLIQAIALDANEVGTMVGFHSIINFIRSGKNAQSCSLVAKEVVPRYTLLAAQK